MAITLGIRLGPTMTALLAAVIVLALIGAVVVALFGVAFPHWIDRRWPATQPLSAREQVWAQMRELVERTFVGLDLELAKELAGEMERVKVPSGTTIFEQGDAATHFYIVQEGEVEVSQRIEVGGGFVAEQVIRHLGAGTFFGEVAIMRRTARTATVRAVSDCVLLRLPAAEFLAGAARSAADEHLLLRTVDRYLADDRRRAEALLASARSRQSP
jgi:CRP-like cAMP-binding protein